MKFCNINFNALNKKDFLSFQENETKILITANAQIITQINKFDWFSVLAYENYISFDGTIPLWVSKIYNWNWKIEKISGSDLMFDLERVLVTSNFSIFLLGGTVNGNNNSVKKYQSKGIIATGLCPEFETYPISEKSSDIFLEEILKFKPDILLVAFGAPKQERWIHDNLNTLKQISPKLIAGVGGSFEMYGDVINKSPKIISNLGLESLWRLIKQPNFQRLDRIIKSFEFFKYI
jgi:N-acetylglucosaminyldiphosphoundecaprenol N-acetyl-beta-D-mannosaminyltransferase